MRTSVWPSGNITTSEGLHMGLADAAHFPLSSAVLEVASRGTSSGPFNTYCSTSDCEYPDTESLALCSSCESEAISANSLTCAFELILENNQNRSFDSLEELRRSVREFKNLSFVEADCFRPYESAPQVLLRLEMSFYGDLPTDVSLYPRMAPDQDGISRVKRGWQQKPGNDPGQFVPQFFETGSNVTNEGYLLFCATQPELDSISTISTSTCFTSTTNLSVFLQKNHVGEVNGTVSICRLGFCVRRYTNIRVRDGVPFGDSEDIKSFHTKDLTTDIENGTMFATANTNNATYKWSTDMQLRLGQVVRENTESDQFGQYVHLPAFQHTMHGNWSLLFQKISEEMSRVIQSSINPYASNITGEAYGAEMFVRVRWQWFVWPVAMTLASVVLLAATIRGSMEKEYLFKNSVLAVLYHGLDAEAARDGYGGKRSGTLGEQAMTEAARNTKVRLIRSEKGALKLKVE
ncbi:hypothetical protein EJ04DRAFT_575549 [Polyplosphaeria fusca]|uniref:Transmembrane protein n=1 Tax=Polyplosphaeria fusca TaxID=682080 RepID=A0A9P4V4C2_9PLEO|nr:hypothetical protein EJ04DRAFT_575549 [Polyplosphaeria fusca]